MYYFVCLFFCFAKVLSVLLTIYLKIMAYKFNYTFVSKGISNYSHVFETYVPVEEIIGDRYFNAFKDNEVIDEIWRLISIFMSVTNQVQNSCSSATYYNLYLSRCHKRLLAIRYWFRLNWILISEGVTRLWDVGYRR